MTYYCQPQTFSSSAAECTNCNPLVDVSLFIGPMRLCSTVLFIRLRARANHMKYNHSIKTRSTYFILLLISYAFGYVLLGYIIISSRHKTNSFFINNRQNRFHTNEQNYADKIELYLQRTVWHKMLIVLTVFRNVRILQYNCNPINQNFLLAECWLW